MNGFLLDTNVISELRRARPHGAVVAWFEAQPADQIHLCAFTLGELQRGVERTRRSDPEKASKIEEWIEELALSHNILPMDGAAFREWAKLMQGKSETLWEDGMVAAAARVNGLTVATRDEADFRALDTPFFNPFKT